MVEINFNKFPCLIIFTVVRIDLYHAEMSPCCVWSFGSAEEGSRFTRSGGDWSCWGEVAVSETRSETCLDSARPPTHPGPIHQVCVCYKRGVHGTCKCIFLTICFTHGSCLFVCYREVLVKMVCGTQTLICYKSKDLLRTVLGHFSKDLNWKQGKTPTSVTHTTTSWSLLAPV